MVLVLGTSMSIHCRSMGQHLFTTNILDSLEAPLQSHRLEIIMFPAMRTHLSRLRTGTRVECTRSSPHRTASENGASTRISRSLTLVGWRLGSSRSDGQHTTPSHPAPPLPRPNPRRPSAARTTWWRALSQWTPSRAATSAAESRAGVAAI